MSDLPKSNLLQRTADIGWMVIEKRSDLRGEIGLLKYCRADESITGVYHTPQSALRSNISAESPDFAATLFSKSLNVRGFILVRSNIAIVAVRWNNR